MVSPLVHKSRQRCATLLKTTSEGWTKALHRRGAKKKAKSQKVVKECQNPAVHFAISVAPLQCIFNKPTFASTSIEELLYQVGLGLTTSAKVFLISASYCGPTSAPTLPAQPRGRRGAQLIISNTLVLRSSWRKWVLYMDGM